MAKRRRLTAARTEEPAGLAVIERPPAAAPRAPIAAAAGEAAATAALEEVAGALRAAREEGRLVEAIPLARIDAEHLMRDRMAAGEEEMAALVASIRAHGQRTPLEVTPLPGEGPRYGLISGWRRLTALGRLHAETGEARFARARALVRPPEGAAEAYVAMVEENEIRADLNHYERARLVARAVEAGVFDDEDAALRALFGAGSAARRSKIKAFVPLYRALGDHLAHPAAISERLGLGLARALRERDGLAGRLIEALGRGPGRGEELALLHAAAEGRAPFAAPAAPAPRPGRGARAPAAAQVAPGLALAHRRRGGGGEIVLSGAAVDAALAARLEAWLSAGG